MFDSFRNRKKFQKEFAELLSDKNVVKWKKVLLAALVIMLASSFLIEAGYIKILVLSVSFLVLASFYMWIFVRAIEKSCMYRLVEPSRLTEGDWIVKDIYVGKQYICGPKDLGISKNQIRKLIKFHRQKKIKKISIHLQFTAINRNKVIIANEEINFRRCYFSSFSVKDGEKKNSKSIFRINTFISRKDPSSTPRISFPKPRSTSIYELKSIAHVHVIPPTTI